MIPASIPDLARRFRYERRGLRSALWRLMHVREDGTVRGDCQDFARTSLRIVSGSRWRSTAWLALGLAVYVVTVDHKRRPHAMLWIAGKGWIDNQNPAFGKRVWPILLPWSLVPHFFVAAGLLGLL